MPISNTFAPPFTPAERQKQLSPVHPKSKIAVVGAGAFGGWSALYLQRAGFQVTLIDTWGPGNSLSSSGDETRVIRSTYGANEFYFDLNVRALELWKENQLRFGHQLFLNSGVLWFCYEERTPIVDDSQPFAKKHGVDYEYLSRQDLGQRYPIVNTDDLHHAYLDHQGGYLKAREGCRCVHAAFLLEGGEYIQTQAHAGDLESGRLRNLRLADGSILQAEAFLF